MSSNTLLGPSCQSCGIPMMRNEDFGREATGVLKVDYCRYCYDRGKFLEPEITFEQMLDKLAKLQAEKRNTPLEEAKMKTRMILLQLKRWRPKPKI